MELPHITSSSYTASAFDMAGVAGLNMVNPVGQFGHAANVQPNFPSLVQDIFMEHNSMAANTTRIVKVFIADPNESIPLSKRLLYSGEEKLTDLTDQELFFEIDMKSLMDTHNKVRISTVNKAVKERTEYLEPVRIRDLKMTVVTVAQF